MFMPMSFMGRWQAVFYIVCCGPVQRFLELPPRTPDRPYLCSLGGCWAPCFIVTFRRTTTTHLLTIPKGTLFVNVCDTFQYMSWDTYGFLWYLRGWFIPHCWWNVASRPGPLGDLVGRWTLDTVFRVRLRLRRQAATELAGAREVSDAAKLRDLAPGDGRPGARAICWYVFHDFPGLRNHDFLWFPGIF